MAFERGFARIEERKVIYLNRKAPPVVSERHTIIEDCHGMQFLSNSPMAPQRVIVNPASLLNLTMWPVIRGNVEVPQTVRRPITSDEAAKLFGGFVVTEFRPKKYWA